MKDQKITVESLCASEDFQEYCFRPNKKNTQYWEEWLKENTSYKEVFEEAKKIVYDLSFHVSMKEVSTEWNTLQKKIGTQKTAKKRILKRRFFSGVAAAFIILVSSIFLWKTLDTTPLKEVTTDFGETQIIYLPDDSKVILNANSELSFSEDWKETENRNVWLKGEAWFEVKHQNNTSFMVHTEKGEVEVLGTSFNVLQRKADFNVALVEGEVQLSLKNDTKINMSPGEQVLVKNNTIDHKKLNADLVMAWQKEGLIFRNASIENVIYRFQNEHNFKIVVEDSTLLKRKINATIKENNPELLLEALKEIYDLNIEKIAERNYLIK